MLQSITICFWHRVEKFFFFIIQTDNLKHLSKKSKICPKSIFTDNLQGTSWILPPHLKIFFSFFSFFYTLYTEKRNKLKNQTVCTLSERNGNQANTLTSYHNAKRCKANAVLSTRQTESSHFRS